MKKPITAAIAAALLLSGCGTFEETYQPEVYVSSAEGSTTNEPAVTPRSLVPIAPAPSRETSETISETSDAHELNVRLNSDKGSPAFTLENVFSEGKYYTVTLSSAENTPTDKTESGAPLLSLYKNGKLLDSLTLDIDGSDRLVILESAAEGLSYGYETISYMRGYGAGEYPDILGLVFRSETTEAAVPEYARYYSVFGGRLEKLPIFENGVEVAPRGAKLEPRSAGFAVQNLTVLKPSGQGYEIVRYEYRFDLENKRLTRQQARFYGWEY